MATDAEIIQYIESVVQGVEADVEKAINMARAEGIAGDLDTSEREISQAIALVKQCKLEADAVRRQYTAESQMRRTEIDKSGRVLGHLVGRGSFGTAFRGGLERGRSDKKAQLAQENANTRNAFDLLELFFQNTLSTLFQELKFIKEMRGFKA